MVRSPGIDSGSGSSPTTSQQQLQDPMNTSQLSFHIQSTSTTTTTSASSLLAIEQRRVREQQVDYENIFDTTEEPDYLFPFEINADVGVLQPKEWFDKGITFVTREEYTL
jgi:hypothetical protein